MEDNQIERPDFRGKSVISQFSAYVRKPTGVNDGGNRAMFYAEAGLNANIVCQFSTDYYWGQTANINVFLIKDRNGNSKKVNGSYPLIASFIGKIEHPTHKNTDGGQTAVFYAEAGENGDIVSKFMQDEYVDALVYIELRGMLSINYPEIFEEQSQKEIEENHSFNLSEKERVFYLKHKDKFVELNWQFQEILTNSKVVSIIEKEVEKGKYISYKEYLENIYLSQEFLNKGVDTHCYHPRCYNLVTKEDIFHYNSNDKYSLYCLCPEHQHELHSLDSSLNERFQSKSLLNKKRWLWNYFVTEFSNTGKEEPDSCLLYQWLEFNKLTDSVGISKKFINGVAKLKTLRG